MLLGWSVARAETGEGTQIPDTTQPVAPATAPGGVNIEVEPGAPGTSTTTRTTTPQGTTTTTTTPGDVNVEVQPAPGQAPTNVDVNVTPPPAATAPPTTTAPKLVPTPGGDTLAPEAQAPAMNNGVSEQTQPVPVQPIPDQGARPYDARQGWGARIGGAVLVGGGVEDFTNNNMQALTGTGGAWNARVVGGTRQIVGLEAAYVGGAHSIDALGLSNSAVLLANGVEGALRLNIPFVARATLVEPFGFVGLGYSRYSVTNTNVNTSSIAGGDDIMTVPFGGGLAVGAGGFMADARFTYRQTYYNDLLRSTTAGNVNTWGVTGNIGFGF
jgi:hypothetical protein